MIWHLIKTGHRPKDDADVVCLFNDGEAIRAYYNASDDTFAPYDQEWDMQTVDASLFKAWCFFDYEDRYVSDSKLCLMNADFLEFSKTHDFPPLLKKKVNNEEHVADDFDVIVQDLGITDIHECSYIYMGMRGRGCKDICYRFATGKDWEFKSGNHIHIYAEINLTPQTLETFNTDRSKPYVIDLRQINIVKFMNDKFVVTDEYPAIFVRAIYKKRCCLPRNRPFKFIKGDKFVAQFEMSWR